MEQKLEQQRLEMWKRYIKDAPLQEIEQIPWEEVIEGKGFRLQQQIIGKGKYSEVVKARNKVTDTVVCCKIFRKSVAPEFIFERRLVTILQLLRHPSLLKIYKCFQTVERLYMFMEFGANGNLNDFVSQYGVMAERRALQIAKEVAIGIHYLHDRAIAHRRMNIFNVFLDNSMKVKIGGLEYFQEVFDITHKDQVT
ncbi:testis-specific serine/threonine-protein kinase 3-like protein, partial [Leptotrombidium deliense]